MTEPAEFKRELIDAFIRLARGDFSVRLPRNRTRDHDDVLAYFVNLIAEELGRLTGAREREHEKLADAVRRLSDAFLEFASGNYAVRVARSEEGEATDVLAYLFNNTVIQVGDAVAEVERQREVVEGILAAMIDGVLVVDATGTINRCNPAMAAMLGRDAHAVAATPLRTHLAATENDLLTRTSGVASPFRDERTRFVDASGRPIELEVNGSPLRDAQGNPIGFVLVARDDRELRAVQAQLLIADRLATVGTVAAGVAHEINNPLAFVIANLEYLDEELAIIAKTLRLEPAVLVELRKALAATIDGAHRVKQIVRDLKAFARAEQDASSVVDLDALADTALSMVRNELRHHARVVKVYGEPPRVVGNEGRLVQVIVNLLQNAAHAITAGDAEHNEVTITTATLPTGEAMLAIRDTGAGIPVHVAVRMFDPFFTTKPVGVGTGLGLAICQKIVGGLDGRLEYDTQLGVGTTFRVILPPAPAHAVANQPMPVVPRVLRRLRLLAIDDEPEIGAALQRNLGRDHDVTFVTRAAAALELIPAGKFDVILCDVMMPEITGVQFLDRLGADHPGVDRRVVFMTGGAFSPGARELLDRTRNLRVDKPFDFAVLRATIAAVADLA
jgi:PAS domain S-box-containing protein